MTKDKSTLFGSVCIHVARLWSYLCLPSINIANDDLGYNHTLFHMIQLGIRYYISYFRAFYLLPMPLGTKKNYNVLVYYNCLAYHYPC